MTLEEKLEALQAHPAAMTAERDALVKTREVQQRNARDTFDAMCAMRDAINEHVPMPSLESDLLQGPENSVFCATVAEAVVATLIERDALVGAVAMMGDALSKLVSLYEAEFDDVSLVRPVWLQEALATHDHNAALEAVKAKARAEGMRKAADICKALREHPDTTEEEAIVAMACCSEILAAAEKEAGK